jgi:hypothetical protein
MSDDDKFFERLRADARALRRQPDEQTLERIRLRIHSHINDRIAPRPTIVDLLAAWFRPLAATAVAIAIAALLGVNAVQDEPWLGEAEVEVTTGGETFSVVD